MYGYELDKGRRERRRELRARAQEELTLQGVALDLEWLLSVVHDDASALGHVLRRAILTRWALDKGASVDQVARHFGVTADQVAGDNTRELLAAASVAEAIEARVVQELPETPEPDRHQPATT